MALDDQLTPDQLNEMIAEIDTDDSGTVDFDGNWYFVDWRNTMSDSDLINFEKFY